jgi:hypothetical protein
MMLRVPLKGTRKQLSRCNRIRIVASTGPADPTVGAVLTKKRARRR